MKPNVRVLVGRYYHYPKITGLEPNAREQVMVTDVTFILTIY